MGPALRPAIFRVRGGEGARMTKYTYSLKTGGWLSDSQSAAPLGRATAPVATQRDGRPGDEIWENVHLMRPCRSWLQSQHHCPWAPKSMTYQQTLFAILTSPRPLSEKTFPDRRGLVILRSDVDHSSALRCSPRRLQRAGRPRRGVARAPGGVCPSWKYRPRPRSQHCDETSRTRRGRLTGVCCSCNQGTQARCF